MRNFNPEEQVIRVRLPQGREILGIVEKRLGGSRMRVNCLDGNARICRIPGRLRRALWVREGDIVIVEPWENQNLTRGDVIFKYRSFFVIIVQSIYLFCLCVF